MEVAAKGLLSCRGKEAISADSVVLTEGLVSSCWLGFMVLLRSLFDSKNWKSAAKIVAHVFAYKIAYVFAYTGHGQKFGQTEHRMSGERPLSRNEGSVIRMRFHPIFEPKFAASSFSGGRRWSDSDCRARAASRCFLWIESIWCRIVETFL